MCVRLWGWGCNFDICSLSLVCGIVICQENFVRLMFSLSCGY